MKYTSYNYSLAIIFLIIIFAFGWFEWKQSSLTIAAALTLPLLPILFLFKNTYRFEKDFFSIAVLGKSSRKIWYSDIQKVEEGKSLLGEPFAKVFYSPYDYVTVKAGKNSNAFIQELNSKLNP